MTKKDCELIAAQLAQALETADKDGWLTQEADSMHNTIAHLLAQAFVDTSPRFEISKFLHAAGVDGY